MGWGYGVLADGREIGYTVEDVCNKDGCEVVIDRGLSYVCGSMHEGGEHGCGKYFCGEHLLFGGHEDPEGESPEEQLCEPCLKRWEAEHPDPALAEPGADR